MKKNENHWLRACARVWQPTKKCPHNNMWVWCVCSSSSCRSNKSISCSTRVQSSSAKGRTHRSCSAAGQGSSRISRCSPPTKRATMQRRLAEACGVLSPSESIKRVTEQKVKQWHFDFIVTPLSWFKSIEKFSPTVYAQRPVSRTSAEGEDWDLRTVVLLVVQNQTKRTKTNRGSRHTNKNTIITRTK